ncbi:MAG: hypothetical protein PHD04_01010 [Candidatus Pacebacteria bacterium]|nr:hypothetical protein [Candidatus Paceibacterota bacterium]
MGPEQANVEYWFRLLYECIYGACYGSVGVTGFVAWFAHLWIWITIIGYAAAIFGLFVIVYCTMRIFELREREEHFYTTLLVPKEAEGGTHPRWEHIQSLLEGGRPSEWREAIIEADIMLDDVLTEQGYEGDGLGEKLRAADQTTFKTIKNAGEAHGVRNKIAHQGSTFDLSESLARRTLAHYEAVFREFKVI